MTEEKKVTNCYTYKVEMYIQILADDEKTAKEQLDKNGGYVSNREAILVSEMPLFSGIMEKKKK